MARIRLDLQGVVARGPFQATDKLRECAFFLGLMKRTRDWARFRWLTSAYLNAARASLDWLAFMVHYDRIDDEGRHLPDEERIRILRKYLIVEPTRKSGKVFAEPVHPLLRELSKHRTVTAHEGPLAIKPERVQNPRQYAFRDDGRGVLEFSEQVLGLLIQIQSELCP